MRGAIRSGACLAATLWLLALTAPVALSQPQEAAGGTSLSPAELDDLAARVASELRCPVCRNQAVVESSADLSREMQALIRERLAAGDTPEQVKEYFVARYGEWILLKPEAKGVNLLVYLLPVLTFLIGGFVVWRLLKRWSGRSARLAPAVAGPDTAAAGRQTGENSASSAAGHGSAGGAGDRAGSLSDRDEAWLRRALEG